MGLLTRTGNILGDLGRNVPAGSKRDRMIGALAGGVEGTQGLLAGKYAQAIQGAMSPAIDALSPAVTAQYAPLAYGLIGAGGSVAGNAMSGEEKDTGRILAEAAGAGGLAALAGRSIGRAGQGLQMARSIQAPVMQSMDQAAIEYATRARNAAKAGASSTAAASRQQLSNVVENMAAGEKAMKDLTRDTRLTQGLYMGGMAGLAGLGGMVGGGVSDAAQAMGVPGFDPNVIADPERPGSSNTYMARNSTPTMRYLG
jgi:hypothetical protein